MMIMTKTKFWKQISILFILFIIWGLFLVSGASADINWAASAKGATGEVWLYLNGANGRIQCVDTYTGTNPRYVSEANCIRLINGVHEREDGWWSNYGDVTHAPYQVAGQLRGNAYTHQLDAEVHFNTVVPLLEEIHIWYGMHGDANGGACNLEVKIKNGSSWTSIYNTRYAQTNSVNSATYNAIIDDLVINGPWYDVTDIRLEMTNNDQSSNEQASIHLEEIEAWGPDPELSVTPPSYDFGTSTTSCEFTVANIGSGALDWSVNEGIAWLSLDKDSGSLPGVSSENVTATVNRTGVTPGSYSGIISFTSSYNDQNVVVWMTVPDPDPELSVNPTSHDFGTSETNYQFTVANTGGGALDWSVSEGISWLSLNKSGGSLSAGSSEDVTATVDRTGQSPGSYSDTISFTSSYGSQNVTVWMTVPEPDPELSVSPISHDFGTSETDYQFTVTNTGGGILNWSVNEGMLWLSLDKSTGSLSGGSSEEVRATVDRTGIAPGSYSGIISFTSSYGSQNVTVWMSVPEPDPELSVSPISHDFGTSETNYQFTVTNTGGGILNWSVNEGILWLSLDKSTGSLSAGSSEEVRATVDRTGIAPGSYSGIISFTSSYGSQNVTVWMSVPEPDPELSVSPTSHDFGTSETDYQFTVTNTGGDILNWSVNEGILWLSLDKSTGSLSGGSSENVTATVDRTGQSPGSYSGTISFTSNYGNQDVSVSMTVLGNPNAPTDLGPINYVDGSWGNDNIPTLEFEQSDPDPLDTLKYTIQIDTNSDFSSPVVNFTSVLLLQGTTSYTCPPLSDRSYYWRVMSTDNSGAISGWSIANGGAIAFKIDTIPPADPTLVLRDQTTGNPEYTDDRLVDVEVGNDGDAFAWLLSETQPTQPAEGDPDWGSEPATFTLSSGDGLKTVYIWVKDAAGNINPGPVSATITLDTTPSGRPVIQAEAYDGRDVQPGDYINVDKVTFTIEESHEYYYKWNTSESDIVTSTHTQLEGPKAVTTLVMDEETSWYLHVLGWDHCDGVTTGQTTFGPITYDLQKPTVTLVVDVDEEKILPDGEIVGVLPDVWMEVRFSKVMDTESVKGLKLIAVRDNLNNSINEEVSLNFEWEGSTKTVITPVSELNKNYLYSLKVTTTVTDLAGNTAEGDREVIFRTIMDHERKNVVAKVTEEKITNLEVHLETKALTEDGYLIINTEPLSYQFKVNPKAINVANEKNITRGWYPVEGCLWEIKACKENGEWMENKFGSEVKITFPYDDKDGVVESASIPVREETLLAFWLNEEHSNWVRVPGSRLDKKNNEVITGEVPHFSVFALAGSAVYDLSDAHAYPVPWKPNDGKDETGTEEDGITFADLSAEGVIKIYSISGELVREYDYKPGDEGEWIWDVKTSHREKVFSGVYIYYIKNEKEDKTGRLMIIR